MSKVDIVRRARLFAIHAHDGQVRKYTGDPYWHHCQSVARMVSMRIGEDNPDHDTIVAAAYLHDTVEDTDVTSVDILDEFGQDVWSLVMALTDKYTHKEYPNIIRSVRKNWECGRMKKVCKLDPRVREIKICDLIDNTSSIVEHDPKFAIVYLREKANLLEAMGFGND